MGTNSETSDPAQRYKRAADYLQQSRRNRKLSVRKIAQMSSMPESTIRALENPRRSKLPTSNVAGLYQIYGEALGVSASKIRKMVGDDQEAKVEFSLRRLPKLKSLVVFSNIGTTVLVAAIVSVVLAYAAWQSFGLISRPELAVSFPEQQFTVVDESLIRVSGSAGRDDTVLVNGEPTTIDSQSGDFSQEVYLQAGYNYVTVEVVNSFSTTNTQDFIVVYQPVNLRS